ncbi:MAG: peptide deformylase [Gammaproteobacteria bacterium RIFCSPHIGHO2_12_FULL_45_9]|nr:MAG: peptide deformylase [Gammaproteobacteria bacterium RIFCSPHIGHO2_12_FULL_45_9]
MSILRILQYPDPLLRRKGMQVTDFGADFQKTVDDMFETHYAETACAALAATQLAIPNAPAVTVIDFSEQHDQPLCLVNPRIVEASGELLEEEACMSVGQAGERISAAVKRATRIRVQAQDRHGQDLDFEAVDFMAKCIQHELDHLQGKLFIDHLSPLKRERLVALLREQTKAKKASRR